MKIVVISEWFSVVKDWLSFFFGNPPTSIKSDRILKFIKGKHCTLIQVRRDTPGAVDTWWFNSPTCTLLITLDNLACISRHLERKKHLTDNDSSPFLFSRNPQTHKIAIFFHSQKPIFLFSFDLNLIKDFNHFEDYLAQKIIETLTIRLKRGIETNEYLHLGRGDIESLIFDCKWWKGRILDISQRYLGENHNLLVKSSVNRKFTRIYCCD